jgi:hypothetical protein
MALALNKILVSGLATNTAAAYLQTTTVTAATTPGTVVPAGLYVLLPTANVSVTVNNGTSLTTWIANNTGGLIISDGQNVNLLSSGGNITTTLLTVDGGQAVSGTFNNV